MKILSEGYRVSAEDRICDYCGGLIEKNERYFYYRGEFNDNILYAILHSRCMQRITEESYSAIPLGDLLLST